MCEWHLRTFLCPYIICRTHWTDVSLATCDDAPIPIINAVLKTCANGISNNMDNPYVLKIQIPAACLSCRKHERSVRKWEAGQKVKMEELHSGFARQTVDDGNNNSVKGKVHGLLIGNGMHGEQMREEMQLADGLDKEQKEQLIFERDMALIMDGARRQERIRGFDIRTVEEIEEEWEEQELELISGI